MKPWTEDEEAVVDSFIEEMIGSSLTLQEVAELIVLATLIARSTGDPIQLHLQRMRQIAGSPNGL